MAYTTIKKPSDYFNTKLYTGTGSSNAITGVGFQPDWTWIKDRDTASNHMVTDAVRGATKTLYTQNADGESTVAQALKSFNTDGFTVGTDGDVNANTKNFASWNWKANGAGSANTDGSINTTYTSVNTTAGFSISSYTGNGSAGATVGHGLGAVPKVIIVKRLNASGGWIVYNEALGNTKIMELHDTSASQTSSAAWNNTSPSSTTFTLGDYTSTNTSGGTYIAYCFAEKTGYSKFGSYVGNGNADGAFIYTGFKPAFVIIKNTSTSGTNWVMFDNKRIGYNESNYYLRPSGNNTESTNIPLDILSNGFKIRTSAGDVNTSGNTYIYMCFAESPFTTSTGIPTTAR